MTDRRYSFETLDFKPSTVAEMESCSADFLKTMQARRTVRDFASTPVPQSIIENAVAAAATAPSGANMQPWHFVAVNLVATKSKIRITAKEEERELYNQRTSDEWFEAQAPLGTDEHKPFLETAPWLIAIFCRSTQWIAMAPSANTTTRQSL